MQALVIILALDVLFFAEAYGIDGMASMELHHMFELCFNYK